MANNNYKTCLFCKHINVSGVECESCHKLLPVKEDENYFALFKLDEVAFSPEELDNSYYKLSSLHHPDKFIDKSSREQVVAQTNSELVNRAYRILKNDMMRWEYILTIHSMGPQNHPNDMHLLEEVMQWSMRLEDELPQDLHKEFQDKKVHLCKEIEIKLAKGLYLEAKKDYITLKYLNRFLTKIDETLSNQ